MTILFDLSYIRKNPYAGVSKYAYRLLDYIVENKLQDNFILILNIVAAEELKKKYPEFKTIVIGNKFLLGVPIIRTLWCSFEYRKVVNMVNADLVFCPWANEITCLKNNKRTISVIHDLQFLIDIHGIINRIYKFIFSLIIRNSETIVTISEFSKNQIKTFFPKYNKNIYNLSNCVSFPDDILGERVLEYKYILYVGRVCKMKNIITLVNAYALAKDQFSKYKLVIVGAQNDYWRMEVEPIVQRYDISSNIVFINDCNENTLYNLYKHSSLFVFPSLREGFGSPPLEAAIMRTPVICTNCDSLEEVTMGQLYTYKNPLDSNELSALMLSVINNPPSAQRLEAIRNFYLRYYSVNIFGEKVLSFLKQYAEHRL